MHAIPIRSVRLFTIFILVAILVTACGAPATTVPDAPTAAVEESESPTETPEAETAPTTAPSSGEGCAPGSTEITWYVGLGLGADAPVIPLEEAWVKKYNESQTEACLILQVVNTQNAVDTLKTMLASGATPDIVGPVGTVGRANFKGAWADLTPLAETAGFDLTQYDPALLEFLKDQGVLVGIPFGLYPSFLYYNRDLFDEARLPYPPHKVGEMYDGKEWNNETFTELAMKMTVDANGNDATSADFDPENIVQYGFFQQFTSARGIATRFEGAVPYAPNDPSTAVIPGAWREAWQWYYDGIWTQHFMPNADAQNSEILGSGNGFASGNIAMAHTHLWFTCCFDVAGLNWDIAVLPTVNGQITANLHGDTFAIMEQSEHKDLAFKVLTDMAQDKELYTIYNVMPAKPEDRAALFAALDARVAPNVVDWSVAEEMAKYPDVPNHEAWLPNVTKSNDLFTAFRTLLDQTPGLDINAEIDKLQAQLDALFKEDTASP